MEVEVIMRDGEPMFFLGHREIEKPKMLAVPVREIVAFSEHGAGGKRHLFTKEQVANVDNMVVAVNPKWVV